MLKFLAAMGVAAALTMGLASPASADHFRGYRYERYPVRHYRFEGRRPYEGCRAYRGWNCPGYVAPRYRPYY